MMGKDRSTSSLVSFASGPPYGYGGPPADPWTGQPAGGTPGGSDPWYGRSGDPYAPAGPYPPPADPYGQQPGWYPPAGPPPQWQPPPPRPEGRSGVGAALVGIFLVLMGLWFLFRDEIGLDVGRWWPAAAVILGVLMVIAAFIPRRAR